jgi:UDP-sugar transporter A1/2/3
MGLITFSLLFIGRRPFISRSTSLYVPVKRTSRLVHNRHASIPISQTQSDVADDARNDLSSKSLALGALVLQSTGLTVAMRLSRIGKASNQMYVPTTAVVLSEVLKLLIALTLRWYEKRNIKEASHDPVVTISKLFSSQYDIQMISFTSALYVIQNNLQYVATSSLPAAIYQILVQMKIITAALFSFFIHKNYISRVQWLSIMLLTLGTIMVQLSVQTMKTVSGINMQLGLIAVSLSCITSALAGVTQESALKDGKLTLWERNTQICTVSFLFAIIATIKDSKKIYRCGFFGGYSPLVYGVIILHALGGLLVSIVVKQTSTIVKGFATSGAILLSCFISLFLLKDVSLSIGLVLGAVIVCLATLGYGSESLFGGNARRNGDGKGR